MIKSRNLRLSKTKSSMCGELDRSNHITKIFMSTKIKEENKEENPSQVFRRPKL